MSHGASGVQLDHIPEPDYEAHVAYGGSLPPPSLRQRLQALRTLSPFLFEVNRQRRRWQRKFRRRARTVSREGWGPEQHAKLAALDRDGAVCFRLPEPAVEEIRTLLEPFRAQLDEKRRSLAKRFHADNNVAVEDERVLARVEQRLREHGFLDVASAHVGVPLELVSMNLFVNDENDTSFWKGEFEPLGVAFPATTYMHIDSGYGPGKFLLYLSEVTEETGPFCFVLGSHRFRRKPGELLLRKAMDQSLLDSRRPENRRLFFALPSFLRKKAAFGFDLDGSHPDTAALLAAERRFLSKDGNLVFFDYDGVHRGGMIERGARTVLQIHLRPTKPSRSAGAP